MFDRLPLSPLRAQASSMRRTSTCSPPSSSKGGGSVAGEAGGLWSATVRYRWD